MKTTKVSAIPQLRSGWRACRAILVLALGLMVCSTQISQAVPMGTAFTYQGRLMDGNNPADGPYDFEFKLYDGPADGDQLGSTLDVNELDAIEGYFTIGLDFGGGIFDGNAVWLEIAVRPGDPCEFVTLSPRQEVMPVPYALYAASGRPGPQGLQGEQGAEGPQGPAGDSHWKLSGTKTYYNNGNVGIGTASPDEKLTVLGTIKASTAEASGYGVLGLATNIGDCVNTGGYFRALGDRGQGVFAHASALSGSNYGVYGRADSSTGRGVYGWAANSSGTNYAVYGRTGSSAGYAGYFVGGRNYFEGNVGIGTASPQQNLSVWEGMNIDQSNSNDGSISPSLRFGTGSSGEGIASKRTSGGNQYGLDFYTGVANRMSITSSGNVGIGTSDPVSKLEVKGRLELPGKDATGTPGTGVIEIGNSLRLDDNEIITNTDEPLFIQRDNNGDLNVDNGTLTVDASRNNVGIGTTNPDDGKLEVNGEISTGHGGLRWKLFSGFTGGAYVGVVHGLDASQIYSITCVLTDGSNHDKGIAQEHRCSDSTQRGFRVWFEDNFFHISQIGSDFADADDQYRCIVWYID